MFTYPVLSIFSYICYIFSLCLLKAVSFQSGGYVRDNLNLNCSRVVQCAKVAPYSERCGNYSAAPAPRDLKIAVRVEPRLWVHVPAFHLYNDVL